MITLTSAADSSGAVAIFWVSAALLFYAFVGYPLLIGALASWARRPKSRVVSQPWPRVSLLISAYNERAVIRRKIENSLTLDYPGGLLEIVVISDCSDDGTDDIVLDYMSRGVRLVRQQERQGKTAGLNVGVPQTTGDIVVFSDANALYERDAITQLVQHFSDPAVGFVVGKQAYLTTDGEVKAEGLYWRLELWLKAQESQFHSVVGGDGAIYAIRRPLYRPLRPTDINDFVNPLQIVDSGLIGVFESRAKCFEEIADNVGQEYRRKIRIVSRSLSAVWSVRGVLNPFRNTRHWFMLVSHKVLRWMAWVPMLTLFVSNVLLWDRPVYQWLGLAQLGFYALAAVGGVLESSSTRLPRLVSLPLYFCLVNVAAAIGIVKFATGSLSGTWKTVRAEGGAAAQAEL